ncbi:MAG: glyceraldehyde 3-phosphate dehydrogenase NAD-binding domain-containing protein [Thalassobaculum sp.]
MLVNDLGPVESNAHLLRYDTVHGRFPGKVTTGEDWMDIGLGKIKVTAERDPANLPLERAGRGHRARMHRHLHQTRTGRQAHRGRREEGASSRRRPQAPT